MIKTNILLHRFVFTTILSILVLFAFASPLPAKAQSTDLQNEQRIQTLLSLIAQLNQLIAQLESARSNTVTPENNTESSDDDSDFTKDEQEESDDFVENEQEEDDETEYADEEDQDRNVPDNLWMSVVVQNATKLGPFTDDELILDKGEKYTINWISEGYQNCKLTTTKGVEKYGAKGAVRELPAPRPGTSVLIFLKCKIDRPGEDINHTERVRVETSDPNNEYWELG